MSCLTAALASGEAFFAGAATAAADPRATAKIAKIRCPAIMPTFFRRTGERALNRSGGEHRPGWSGDAVARARREGFRINSPEQRFHAAVPAELERMRACPLG